MSCVPSSLSCRSLAAARVAPANVKPVYGQNFWATFLAP